ncbi:MAG: MupG family TIM beta-alpha barrel fold protein [Lactobacillaceae bacterium]|jgi:hypothetical protein|nr:MupG family TIM beta-alpha barrel fold protein [Lactobacillaceae bacterium]
MFGFSVFLNEDLSNTTVKYIKLMKKTGFSGIFTSLHIPEDDAKKYRTRLIELGQIAHENQLELMVDISGEALERAGFHFDKIEALTEIGVTGLRMDYQISMEQIAQVSHAIKISLNASTLTLEEVEKLHQLGADFSNLQAWHNYYPRPETGLDEVLFYEKNHRLKKLGFKIAAFVPGDANLRGPLFAGLPTLERDRGAAPFSSALRIRSNSAVDIVYIGDGGLLPATIQQFANYVKTDVIELRVKVISDEYFHLVEREHINRQDAARDCLRSAEARFWDVPVIQAEPVRPRKIGAITIDNQLYQRYMGEIQIMRRELADDEKTNIVGYVIDDDLPLIEQIGPGQKFRIVKWIGEKDD